MVSEPDKSPEMTEAPNTFDQLAAGIEEKFREVDAEVEAMNQQLQEANAKSEPLLRRLLDVASLPLVRSSGMGRPIDRPQHR